jgi:hypothetical protein
VNRDGAIKPVVTLTDVVPTGLDVADGRVFFTELGPIPHHPEDGKVFELNPRTGATTQLACSTARRRWSSSAAPPTSCP